jgi:hypothetical protein
MFDTLPDEINKSIANHLCLRDQVNFSSSHKYINGLLRYKLLMYENEFYNINTFITTFAEQFAPRSLVSHYIVFRWYRFKIKISMNSKYKLKFYDSANLNETISTSFYFERVIELKCFIKRRILTCTMYSNTLLFSHRYKYNKIYST